MCKRKHAGNTTVRTVYFTQINFICSYGSYTSETSHAVSHLKILIQSCIILRTLPTNMSPSGVILKAVIKAGPFTFGKY